ncbi:MAG: ribosome silencing factor [Candidatus Omnitrophica bacterium]|nr:ribosome silencing factor [Candidatus Omnitrophota bacterium]
MPGCVIATGPALESQAKALLAATAALEKHAEGVVVMDVRGLSDVTDFFVVCTAGSTPQLDAIKDHIETSLTRQGASVWHTEGTITPSASRGFGHDPQWVLMDCGEVVVHVLDPQAWTFYRLEELWADAPRVPVASLETPSAKPPQHGSSEGVTRAG